MGVKTYTEFQSDLLFELGNPDNLTAYTGPWVNESYLDFCTRERFWTVKIPSIRMFPELNASGAIDATVDGTAYVTRPTDAIQVYAVWDSTNDRKMDNIGWREYIAKTGRATAASESEPKFWATYGSYLYLYPTPDDAYALTVYYRKRPAVLTGTDVTVIGAEWDEAVTKLAVVKSMLKMKRYDDFKIEKDEFMDMLASKIGFYADERMDANIIVKPDIAYNSWDGPR